MLCNCGSSGKDALIVFFMLLILYLCGVAGREREEAAVALEPRKNK